MRILIVTQYFWPENFRINEIAEHLAGSGHAVTVLTGRPNYPDGAVFPEYRAAPDRFAGLCGAEIVRVPIVPRGSGSLRLILNYASFVLSGALIGAWKLRRRRFDVIFMFQTSPVTAALPAVLLRRLKRAPMLMWVLDLWPETLSAVNAVRSVPLLRLVGALVAFIYRRTDRILISSAAFAANVERYADDRSKLRYFPGWPEAATIMETGEVAPELARFGGGFNVLFAGNIGEAQDFPAILEAVEALADRHDIRWLIVGGGRAEAELREQIARRGLGERIHLLGRHPVERMPSFFNGADALLVSLKPEPIFALTVPGKVQTYLAAGKPILGMLDGEGARVIEASGGGLTARAGDGAGLAEQARRLADMSPEERAAMGASARRYGEAEFDRAKLFERLETWLREAAAGGVSAPGGEGSCRAGSS